LSCWLFLGTGARRARDALLGALCEISAKQMESWACARPRSSAPAARIIVAMDAPTTELPCGPVETGQLLELLWRQTGADCDGEQAALRCHCAAKYHIELRDHGATRSSSVTAYSHSA